MLTLCVRICHVSVLDGNKAWQLQGIAKCKVHCIILNGYNTLAAQHTFNTLHSLGERCTYTERERNIHITTPCDYEVREKVLEEDTNR